MKWVSILSGEDQKTYAALRFSSAVGVSCKKWTQRIYLSHVVQC